MKKIETNEEIQFLLKELLRNFDEICRKNNLKYSVAYGTLLGTIREKGFIPWDNDVDVVMPREDYEKLLDLRYNDGRYEVKSYRYSKNYNYIFSKLSDNTTKIVEENRDGQELGVYLDIFPVENIPYERFKKNTNKIDYFVYYFYKLYSKFGPNSNKPNSELSPKKIIAKYFHKMTNPFTPAILRVLEKQIASTKGDYALHILHNFAGHRDSFYAYEWDNIIELPFEDIQVYAFANYDEMLKDLYGDYMTPPPENERHSHLFEAYYL